MGGGGGGWGGEELGGSAFRVRPTAVVSMSLSDGIAPCGMNKVLLNWTVKLN